jgi:hypothetical protein
VKDGEKLGGAEIARRLGIGRASVYRVLSKNGADTDSDFDRYSIPSPVLLRGSMGGECVNSRNHSGPPAARNLQG